VLNRTRTSLAGTVVVCLLVAGVAAGCSSDLPDSQKGSEPAGSQTASKAAGQTFSGTLVSKPATRTIHLVAGEALRWSVRPVGDDYIAELALAIATDLTAIPPKGFSTTRDFSDYSDIDGITEYGNLFSEDSQKQLSLDLSDLGAYGIPVVTTHTHASFFRQDDGALTYPTNVRTNPLFFTDSGIGGRDDGFNFESKGAWISFIAPQEGNYTLIIGGFGGFTSSYTTQKSPLGTPNNAQFDPSQPTAPFTDQEWVRLCESQLDFLYDNAGYPGGTFIWESGDPGDEDYEKVDLSPATHLKSVKHEVAEYADYLAHPDE
jgi:hypothetical protein